jgi:hypothetical protein
MEAQLIFLQIFKMSIRIYKLKRYYITQTMSLYAYIPVSHIK